MHESLLPAGSHCVSPAPVPVFPILYITEVYGHHHGQTDARLTARAAGSDETAALGYVDFSFFGGEVHVNLVEVEPSFRRRGIGKGLLLKLREEAEGKPIRFGLCTEEGYALVRAFEQEGGRPCRV